MVELDSKKQTETHDRKRVTRREIVGGGVICEGRTKGRALLRKKGIWIVTEQKEGKAGVFSGRVYEGGFARGQGIQMLSLERSLASPKKKATSFLKIKPQWKGGRLKGSTCRKRSPILPAHYNQERGQKKDLEIAGIFKPNSRIKKNADERNKRKGRRKKDLNRRGEGSMRLRTQKKGQKDRRNKETGRSMGKGKRFEKKILCDLKKGGERVWAGEGRVPEGGANHLPVKKGKSVLGKRGGSGRTNATGGKEGKKIKGE